MVWTGDRPTPGPHATPIDLAGTTPLNNPDLTRPEMMTETTKILAEMNDRSREVFRRVVEGYLDTGAPMGSRTLTRSLSEKVSAATVRNVMQDLEYMGLLGSPHVSAGRVPTQLGLRMFVDGLQEVGDLTSDDRKRLDDTLGDNTADVTHKLDRLGSALSGVAQGASLVLTPKREAPIQHVEFVSLSPAPALAALVGARKPVPRALHAVRRTDKGRQSVVPAGRSRGPSVLCRADRAAMAQRSEGERRGDC